MTLRTMPSLDEICPDCRDVWGCSCPEPYVPGPRATEAELEAIERKCAAAFGRDEQSNRGERKAA